ncbi:MAG: xanthine dehydrogenase family protein molybdopterin-binding subunit [Polyangiaceae bacterium]|nr:xanthine dehydrogenase family protein molybdopterin-binding subunit [Polyangiaceae bacterium]
MASEHRNTMEQGVSRRFFLGLVMSAGAGFAIGCESTAPTLPPKVATNEKPQEAKVEAPKAPFVPDAWIRVAPDSTVTVVIDKAEMGQGVETALAMLAAEELHVALSSVKTEWAPADPAYKNKLFGMQATGGSTTIRGDMVPMRKAGAAARMMLVAAAAEKLGVSADELSTETGHVLHAKTNQRIPYGDLVELAAKQKVPQDPPLAARNQHELIGTRPQRIDARAKGAGKAQFGIDVKVPDMKTAVVVRSPVPGGKVAKFDAEKALAVRNVRKVFQISSGIAVVADNFWAAKKGAEALTVTWDPGAGAAVSTDKLLEDAKNLVKKPGLVAQQKGDFDAAWKKAKKKLEVTYEQPFQAHAPMEPLNAAAHVRADGCDIWAGHQAAGIVQMVAAKVTGLEPKAIKVHTTYLGGGFGRRFEMDFVLEAIEASKQFGGPVKVVWTREDDIRHDYYRPATYSAVKAALGADGMPLAVRYQVVGASVMARVFPQNFKDGIDKSSVEGLGEEYALPNLKIEYHRQEGVPVGFWRSVGHSTNAFVQESLLDELATMAKMDPVEYRRKLLADSPRMKRVLEVVANKSGWGTALEKGRGRGVAVHHSFGSYIAQVAEVTVAGGKVKVDRVICAVDCGEFVHPGIVEAQMESGIIFGLTAVLKSSIRIEEGKVKQANFHNFKLIGMDEAPAIEVYVVPSGEAPGGTGEPGTPPIAPAVANAVFAATGKRIRRLPITADDLK